MSVLFRSVLSDPGLRIHLPLTFFLNASSFNFPVVMLVLFWLPPQLTWALSLVFSLHLMISELLSGRLAF